MKSCMNIWRWLRKAAQQPSSIAPTANGRRENYGSCNLRYARANGTKMIRYLFMLAFLIAATASHAQSPAPALGPKYPPKSLPPASAYCLAASAAFLESDAKASDEVRKCTRGDTVVIPSRNASAVARMCDFSKAVATLGDNVVCVLVSPERVSR